MASNEKDSCHISRRSEGLQQGVKEGVASDLAQESNTAHTLVDYFLTANPRPLLQLEVHVLNTYSDNTSLVEYCRSQETLLHKWSST